MKKWYSIVLLALVVMVMVAGCGSESPSTPTEDKEVDSEQTEVTFTDALGHELTLTGEPERIITLVPSNTEVLYALDKVDDVIGITSNDNFPEGIEDEKEVIGDMDVDLERVLALNPDLVLASTMQAEETLESLIAADLPVFVVEHPNTIADVYTSIETIADVTGTTDKAEEVIASMKERLAAIEEKAATIPAEEVVSVWLEVWPAPYLSAPGSGTFIHEMIEAVGAVNAAENESGWPQWTEEDAVLLNPDVIITTYSVEEADVSIEDVLNRPAWQEVEAIKNEQVFYYEYTNMMQRPGPRVVEGIEKLANLVYPETFAE